MSLINDALKRANQSLKEQSGKPKEGAPMTPVRYRGEPVMRTLIMVPLLLIGLIGAAGLFIWHWQHTEDKTAVALEITNKAAPNLIPTPIVTNQLPAPVPAIAEAAAVGATGPARVGPGPVKEGKDGAGPNDANRVTDDAVTLADINLEEAASLLSGGPSAARRSVASFMPWRPASA